MYVASPEKRIRLQAKEALADKWTSAVGASFTASAFVMISLYCAYAADLIISMLIEGYEEFTMGLVALVLFVTALLYISPVFIGFMRFFYLTVKGEDSSLTDLFYYFGRRYGNTLNRVWYVFIRCLGRILLSFLPCATAYFITAYLTYDKEELAFSDIICYVIVYALLFAGILLCMNLCRKYFLSFFLYIEDENLCAAEMCSRSEMYLLPLGKSITKLNFSLFPMMLSCILVIPCIFVVPYITATLSTSAKWIIALYAEQTENKDE